MNWPGLSPRGRGKLILGVAAAIALGSIPAWAGETAAINCSSNSRAVYPRVGGGNRAGRPGVGNDKGLSPRGRGKPPAPALCSPRRGSIPAWAGETDTLTKVMCPCSVYPRVGGGNMG